MHDRFVVHRDEAFWCGRSVFEVVHALRRGLLINRERDAPMWLGPHNKDRPTSNLVACKNGILNLETRELLPHDPLFLTMNCLPLEYDPKAAEPERWYQFLEEIWPDDEEAEICLQEIVGYLLTSDVRQHKAFLICGPGRSGKGTIVYVIRELIGQDNVVFQTLKSMAGEFGRWPLVDKKLAVIGDTGVVYSGVLNALRNPLRIRAALWVAGLGRHGVLEHVVGTYQKPLGEADAIRPDLIGRPQTVPGYLIGNWT